MTDQSLAADTVTIDGVTYDLPDLAAVQAAAEAHGRIIRDQQTAFLSYREHIEYIAWRESLGDGFETTITTF